MFYIHVATVYIFSSEIRSHCLPIAYCYDITLHHNGSYEGIITSYSCMTGKYSVLLSLRWCKFTLNEDGFNIID